MTTNTISRRDILQLASGLGLSLLLPGLDFKAAEKRGAERKKSLIIIWLAGGPSQLETWDPHPNTKIGGPTTAINTSIPKLKIASHFPQVAEQIHLLSVIRSLVSKEGDHERGTMYLKTGYPPNPTLHYPALGAILAHQLPDDNVEIPMHITLGNAPFPSRGGYLGDQFDAFKIYNPGQGIRNMEPRVGSIRQTRRLNNLDVVSQAFRQGRRLPVEKSLHQNTIERALKMMRSEQLKAFDLSDEPDAVKSAYGDSNFGRGCLVARRLIEQGVRTVEVTLTGFDSHANNFQAHQNNAAILDPALASLLNELKERDLFESTVLLCIGEFGRTPRINPLDGRDHWPNGFSCLLGGGGLKSATVIGETDPSGQKKKPDVPVEIGDLCATILKTIGVQHDYEYDTPIGRPIAFSSGTPLEQLL